MAITTYQNMRYYSGPALEKDKLLATAASTWKAGQPGYLASGRATPCATNATAIKFIFSSDRNDTSATDSYVSVEKIPSAATKFVARVINANTDTTAPATVKGATQALYVASNVATINLNNDTTGQIFYIDDLMANKDPNTYDVSDVPGNVIGHFVQSALDA